MKTRLTRMGAVGVASVLFALSASAHHGASATYDIDKSITVSGTVTDFQFVNPHVLVFFAVKEPDGKLVQWSGGLTSPNRLARSDGWNKHTLKPGDQITVTGHPARNGAPSVWVLKILDANGKPLIEGNEG